MHHTPLSVLTLQNKRRNKKQVTRVYTDTRTPHSSIDHDNSLGRASRVHVSARRNPLSKNLFVMMIKVILLFCSADLPIPAVLFAESFFFPSYVVSQPFNPCLATRRKGKKKAFGHTRASQCLSIRVVSGLGRSGARRSYAACGDGTSTSRCAPSQGQVSLIKRSGLILLVVMRGNRQWV